MSRAVCSDCGSKLNRGRCPTCGPGYEVVARPAKPIRATDPDDEPPAPSRGMGPVWVVAAGLGGLLLGTAIIGGAVLLREKRANPEPVVEKPVVPKPAADPKPPPVVEKPAPAKPAPAKPPISWTPFRSPDGAFAADFPNGEPAKATGLLGDLGKAVGDSSTWARSDGDRKYTATTLTIDPVFGGTGLGDDIGGVLGIGGETTDVRVGGHPGKQSVARVGDRAVVQQVVKVRQTTFLFAVEGPLGLLVDDDVKRFFAGIRIPAGK